MKTAEFWIGMAVGVALTCLYFALFALRGRESEFVLADRRAHGED